MLSEIYGKIAINASKNIIIEVNELLPTLLNIETKTASEKEEIYSRGLQLISHLKPCLKDLIDTGSSDSTAEVMATKVNLMVEMKTAFPKKVEAIKRYDDDTITTGFCSGIAQQAERGLAVTH